MFDRKPQAPAFQTPARTKTPSPAASGQTRQRESGIYFGTVPYLPAFVARTIGESINATKGVSRGEDIWLSFPRTHNDPNIGFDHFQVYFTARMWWGGKEADVEAMLDESCRLFYGPAGPKMKTFFEYCEANYQAMESDKEKIDAVLEIFTAARANVASDSIHGQRLALIDKERTSFPSWCKLHQLELKQGQIGAFLNFFQIVCGAPKPLKRSVSCVDHHDDDIGMKIFSRYGQTGSGNQKKREAKNFHADALRVSVV